MGDRILITGGTGFIGQRLGQRLCQALLAGESRLTVLSRQDPVTVRSLCGRAGAANSLDTLHGDPGCYGGNEPAIAERTKGCARSTDRRRIRFPAWQGYRGVF